ncbi:MAG: response regulator [Bacteroidota bacterium]|nr:response regulator [Bacteroidota bacterium]
MSFKNSHVLVIDDNEDILFIIESMLKLKGYTVSTKENGDDLKDFIFALSPNIILMDMILKEGDGRKICQNLKADKGLSAIPIVMLSAHPDAKQECLASGANYFLEKPFDMQELYQAVSHVLS